jgi:hypothetical protein
VVTEEELEQLLSLGHEFRHLEVKGPCGLGDKALVAKVARAVMAMGNLRDGGLVCIGIDDGQIAHMLPGLTADQLADWTDFDKVSAALGKYSDPPVSFEIRPFKLSSGADIVVLEVTEFERDVHVCKKSFQGVLKDGETYVRPRGQPRSVPPPTSADMRELHDLAVDKGVREFVRRAGAAGVPLNATSPALTTEEADRAAFDAEREQAWAASSVVDAPSPEAASSPTPAYFDVAIRPGPYEADRVTPAQLDSFVAEQAVRLRGWPVPMVSSRDPVQRHGTWLAQDSQSAHHIEAWRIFTSGQFLHRRLLVTDIRETSGLQAEDPGATGAVVLWDVLFYTVELSELGARIATRLGCEAVTLDVSLRGIAGRELISGDHSRQLFGPYLSAADSFSVVRSVDAPTLLTDPRTIGVELAQGLLRQFGLDVPDQILRDYQEQTLRP